jgi:hypothetical protein
VEFSAEDAPVNQPHLPHLIGSPNVIRRRNRILSVVPKPSQSGLACWTERNKVQQSNRDYPDLTFYILLASSTQLCLPTLCQHNSSFGLPCTSPLLIATAFATQPRCDRTLGSFRSTPASVALSPKNPEWSGHAISEYLVLSPEHILSFSTSSYKPQSPDPTWSKLRRP